MATIDFNIEEDENSNIVALHVVRVWATEAGHVCIGIDGEEPCEMMPIEAQQLARLIEACAEAAAS